MACNGYEMDFHFSINTAGAPLQELRDCLVITRVKGVENVMKNSVTSIILVVFLAAFTVVVSFTSARQAAAAGNQKLYAGANCFRWNQTVDPRSYLSSSRKFNPSGKRLRVDCQAVRDTTMTRIASSWIRVIDRSPTEQVCARIVAYSQSGSGVISRVGPNRCTGIGSNSTSPVQLNTGALSSIPSRAHIYISVNAIPASYSGRHSGVVNYFIDER